MATFNLKNHPGGCFNGTLRFDPNGGVYKPGSAYGVVPKVMATCAGSAGEVKVIKWPGHTFWNGNPCYKPTSYHVCLQRPGSSSWEEWAELEPGRDRKAPTRLHVAAAFLAEHGNFQGFSE